MRIWQRLFKEHPASVDETYGQHLVQALGFGLGMIWGGLACLVHAFIPALCEKSGSTMIAALHERMVTNRRRVPRPPQALGLGARKAA